MAYGLADPQYDPQQVSGYDLSNDVLPSWNYGSQPLPGSDVVSQMIANNPGINPQLAQFYAQHGITPSGQGTGAGDYSYWNAKFAQDPNYYGGRILQAYNNPGTDGGSGFGFGTLASYTGPAFQAPDALNAYQPIGVGSFGYTPLGNQASFQLPTGQQALDQDPGYQFRLQQGLQSLEQSAAGKGITGNRLQSIVDYGQNAASQEYQNAYNRALQAYQTNTGTNLAAQQQQYQQGLGAFQTNAQTALQANNQNFQNALAQYQANFQDPLAAYQANVNAQLGFGGLGLQAQGLGLQSALGFGNLGINQGYLGLAGDQQGYNQLLGVTNLGLSGTQGAANTGLGYFNGLTNLYGNNAAAQGNLYGTGASAYGAGQVGSANAYQGALGNLGNLGMFAGAGGFQPRQPIPQPNPSQRQGGVYTFGGG